VDNSVKKLPGQGQLLKLALDKPDEAPRCEGHQMDEIDLQYRIRHA
jgi:hypothetical protein